MVVGCCEVECSVVGSCEVEGLVVGSCEVEGSVVGSCEVKGGGGAKSKKVDLLRYFWKIDLEKIYFFYFFDLYFCFLKAFFGLKYTS